jgi:hypothetical protein
MIPNIIMVPSQIGIVLFAILSRNPAGHLVEDLATNPNLLICVRIGDVDVVSFEPALSVQIIEELSQPSNNRSWEEPILIATERRNIGHSTIIQAIVITRQCNERLHIILQTGPQIIIPRHMIIPVASLHRLPHQSHSHPMCHNIHLLGICVGEHRLDEFSDVAEIGVGVVVGGLIGWVTMAPRRRVDLRLLEFILLQVGDVLPEASLPALVTIGCAAAIGDVLVVVDKDDGGVVDGLEWVQFATEAAAADVGAVEVVLGVAWVRE